jgi:DASS family divalent anion:Na+ symporter
MGPMSSVEKVAAFVFMGALTLWVSAGLKQFIPWAPVVDATIVALMGVSTMLLTGVLEWRDIIEEGGAWDSLVWMGSTVALADALSGLGFIAWFASTVSLSISGIPWVTAFVILMLVYMYSHYAFASLTAHVTAMYAAFVAVAVAAGAPPMMAALAFGFLSNLCMSLTHYAAGPAPIFFNTGFVSQGAWWKLGFITSIVNLVIWIGAGSFWWKVIGLW